MDILTLSNQTIVTAQNLIEITAPNDNAVFIYRVGISLSPDMNDFESQLLRILIRRNEIPIYAETFDIQNGFHFPPRIEEGYRSEMKVIVLPKGLFVIELKTTPVSPITIDIEVVSKEVNPQTLL